MQHVIHVGSPWFNYLKSGEKKWEGRCKWRAALNYKVGDTWEVHYYQKPSEEDAPEPEPFTLKIEGIVRFPTFEKALSLMNLSEVLPGVKTIEEGVQIYFQFVSLKTQEANGVLMFRVAKTE
jgi:ASC-1-like (ASCH) protein